MTALAPLHLPYWATQEGTDIKVTTLNQALIVTESIPPHLADTLRVVIESPTEAAKVQRLIKAVA